LNRLRKKEMKKTLDGDQETSTAGAREFMPVAMKKD
jgi:hypothetical protein